MRVEVNGPSCIAEFLQDPKEMIGIHLDLSGEHKSFISTNLAKKSKNEKALIYHQSQASQGCTWSIIYYGIYYGYVEKRTCNVERCS